MAPTLAALWGSQIVGYPSIQCTRGAVGSAAEHKEGRRRPKAEVAETLQDETMSSILGYAASQESAAAHSGPMLLGRTNLEALDQVKGRASTARKQQTLRAFLVSSGFKDVNARKELLSSGRWGGQELRNAALVDDCVCLIRGRTVGLDAAEQGARGARHADCIGLSPGHVVGMVCLSGLGATRPLQGFAQTSLRPPTSV